jgi:hypothetical protein
VPAPARGPGTLDTDPEGIPVNGVDNGPRKRKAPSIYLFMGLHGKKCSIPERYIQQTVADWEHQERGLDRGGARAGQRT